MRWQLDFCCTICLWHSIFKSWFLLSDISQFPPCKVIKSGILVRISILNLLPLFLKDLNSWHSDKPNPRSWKPYWRPSVTEVPPPKKSKSERSLILPSFYPWHCKGHVQWSVWLIFKKPSPELYFVLIKTMPLYKNVIKCNTCNWQL